MPECIKYVSSNAINRLIIHNVNCQMEVMMFQNMWDTVCQFWNCLSKFQEKWPFQCDCCVKLQSILWGGGWCFKSQI